MKPNKSFKLGEKVLAEGTIVQLPQLGNQFTYVSFGEGIDPIGFFKYELRKPLPRGAKKKL